MTDQKDKLNYTFQLWYDHFQPEKQGKDYQKSQIIVGEFDTIQIKTSQNLNKSKREDEMNSDGSNSKLKITEKFDDLWIETIVLWLSNEFKEKYEEEFINGISITKKQNDLYILQIWQNNKEEPEDFYETWKQQMKKNVNISDIPTLVFKLCFDSIRSLRRKTVNSKPIRTTAPNSQIQSGINSQSNVE